MSGEDSGALIGGLINAQTQLVDPNTGAATRAFWRLLTLLHERTGGAQSAIEALRAGVDEAELRKVILGDIDNLAVTTDALGVRAATSTSFSATNSFGPFTVNSVAGTVFDSYVGGTGTNDDPQREMHIVEVSLTDINPGDPLEIKYDGLLIYSGNMAERMCWHEKVFIMEDAATFNNDYFGDGGSDDYATVTDNSRSLTRLMSAVTEANVGRRSVNDNISVEADAQNTALRVPGALQGITITTAPSDADTVDYKVVVVFVLDRDVLPYQSNSQIGFKQPNSRNWEIRDLDVMVTNLKEKQ